MHCDMKTARLILLAATLGGIFWVSAGDLNPPAGPVTPTMKTLDQVEARTPISSLPFTIDQGGSYYLTGSLTGVSGSNGITITASDVTLDLNGFTLKGVPGSLDGIHVAGFINNLTVRNGGVVFWKDDGVDAANALDSRVEDVRSYGNVGTGVKIGPSSTVRNSGGPNGGDGISTGARCMIINCMANGSSGNGIVAGPHNRVEGCAASFNGLIGIQTGDGSIVTDCTASNNFSDGIVAGPANRVAGCTATLNGKLGIGTGIGIQAGNGSIVANCTATNNFTDGISLGSSGNVMGCTAVDNTQRGILAGGASTVVNCTATGNGDDGIATGQGSTIRGCSSSNNETGIDANVRSTVISCTTNGNTFRGISNSGGSVAQCTSTANGTFGMTCGVALGNTAFSNNPDIGAGCINAHNDCNTCDDP